MVIFHVLLMCHLDFTEYNGMLRFEGKRREGEHEHPEGSTVVKITLYESIHVTNCERRRGDCDHVLIAEPLPT